MKKGCSVKRKAQMNLSFGMIFSVFLIVFFLVFAFFAVKKFIGISDTTKIYDFVLSLQSRINDVMKSDHGSINFEYRILPTSVDRVCLVDFSASPKGVNLGDFQTFQKYSSGMDKNLIIDPVSKWKGMNSFVIENINLQQITENENPYCFTIDNGVATATISKGIKDILSGRVKEV